MDESRTVPERKHVKAALRAAGLSVRQVDALLRDGWRGLVDGTRAENDELRDRLADLQHTLDGNRMT